MNVLVCVCCVRVLLLRSINFPLRKIIKWINEDIFTLMVASVGGTVHLLYALFKKMLWCI